MVRLKTTIYLRTGAYFVSLFELLGELNPPMAQTKALESRGGLQRHDNIVTFYYIRLTFLDVEPTQPTPSTAPPLPCETHPAQRSPIKLLEMINRWFQEPVRAPIRDCRVLCFFFVFWGFLEYHFQFEKESRAFRRTKSHTAEGSWEATGWQGERC